MRADVPNDYCAQTRPAGMFTLGAIEHAVGTCDTTRPPVDQNPPVGGDITSSGGDAGIGTPSPDGGCCETGRAERSLPLALVVLLGLRRRRG